MTKMIKTRINGRWDLMLPEHRAKRPEWDIKNGGWEKARLDSMFKTVKKGDTVYYVGAEEGDICALLTMWGAELVLFEPNYKVWPNIRASYKANNLKPPLYSFAGFAGNVSDTPTQMMGKLRRFPKCAYGEIISDHGFKNLCEADGTVGILKIDDVVKDTACVPDMITLDVEGAEFEVLYGAEQTLRRYMPRVYLSLHPEFMYEIYKVYSSDLRGWLKNMGYKETLLDYQHEVHLLYEKE